MSFCTHLANKYVNLRLTEKDIVRKLLTKLLLENDVHFGPYIVYNPICVTGIYSSPFVFDLPIWCEVIYRLGIPHSICSDGDSPSWQQPISNQLNTKIQHILQLASSTFVPKCGFQTQRYREAEYSKIKMVRQICGNFIIWKKGTALLIQSNYYFSTN